MFCCTSRHAVITLALKHSRLEKLLFQRWIHHIWKCLVLRAKAEQLYKVCSPDQRLNREPTRPPSPPKIHKATWSVKLALSIRIAGWQIFTLLPPALTSGSMGTSFPPLRRFTYIKWRGGSSEWTIDGCQARQQGMDVWAWSWQQGPQRVNCFAGTN